MALRGFSGRGGLTSRSMRDGAVNPSKLSTFLRDGSYALENFVYTPVASDTDGYSAPTGSTGDYNLLNCRNLSATYHVKGAGQTLLSPTQDTTVGGILAGLDAAASEGVEYIIGQAQTAKNPFASTIGTSVNKFVRATVAAGTVANVGEMAVGWRKAEAGQAAIDSYDEMAVLNCQYDTDACYVRMETILNNGTTDTTETGSTIANAEQVVLEVRLLGRKAKVFVNGAEPAGMPNFQFDVGEVVIPFIFWLQNGSGGSTFHIFDLEVGPLAAIGLDPARR